MLHSMIALPSYCRLGHAYGALQGKRLENLCSSVSYPCATLGCSLSRLLHMVWHFKDFCYLNASTFKLDAIQRILSHVSWCAINIRLLGTGPVCVCCHCQLKEHFIVAGILAPRCQLLTNLGMKVCALATLLPGAARRSAAMLKGQVKVKVPTLHITNNRVGLRAYSSYHTGWCRTKTSPQGLHTDCLPRNVALCQRQQANDAHAASQAQRGQELLGTKRVQ